MEEKLLKRWYVVAGATAGIGLLFCAIRWIADLATPAYLGNAWNIVTYIGFGFVCIAVLMLLALIGYSYINEKKNGSVDYKKANDDEQLLKYKSKKK